MPDLPAAATAITRNSYVRHKVYVHRGIGKVMEVGPTFLRCQTPKLQVAFERGGRLWCFPDDLIQVQCPAAAQVGAKPTLTVVEHPQVVA